MEGKVYLVGAGPGDKDLITVRGLEAIKEADVILYDYLANDSLLGEARDEAELIYVGKKAGSHHYSQEEINLLFKKYTAQGKVITRLKGGDPFVFGRGGEEAGELARENIKFEIIPGVTSAVAVPAYAGIPVTHRSISSSVVFVTGHEDPAKGESTVDWAGLTRAADTLVILMGVSHLEDIVEKLLAAGKKAATPVALIRWGTRSSQETITGRLDEIAARVKAVNFKAPAVIVVGEVVSLREELKWFEKKPLFAKNIVVTRPEKQAEYFCRALEKAGAAVFKVPAIEIFPAKDYDCLDNSIENLKKYDWLIFTSVNGVKYFMERLFIKGRDVRDLSGIKLAAIGPVTAAQLADYGLLVDYLPDDYSSEAVIDGFSDGDIRGSKILLPRTDIAPRKLAVDLEKMGAEVDSITTYRTVGRIGGQQGSGQKNIIEELKNSQIDMVTFTSSSTANNFIQGLGNNYQQLLMGVEIACIGPITAGAIRNLGLKVDITAEEYTINGLIKAIINYYQKKSRISKFGI